MQAWSEKEKLFLLDHITWPSKKLAGIMGRTANGIDLQKVKLNKERKLWDEFRFKFARRLGIKLKTPEPEPAVCSVYIDLEKDMDGTPEECAESLGWSLEKLWRVYWQHGRDTALGFVEIRCNKYA